MSIKGKLNGVERRVERTAPQKPVRLHIVQPDELTERYTQEEIDELERSGRLVRVRWPEESEENQHDNDNV